MRETADKFKVMHPIGAITHPIVFKMNSLFNHTGNVRNIRGSDSDSRWYPEDNAILKYSKKNFAYKYKNNGLN